MRELWTEGPLWFGRRPVCVEDRETFPEWYEAIEEVLSHQLVGLVRDTNRMLVIMDGHGDEQRFWYSDAETEELAEKYSRGIDMDREDRLERFSRVHVVGQRFIQDDDLD